MQRPDPSDRGPIFLMCPPDHFTVSYTINPWMDPEGWHADEAGNLAQAKAEWQELKDLYESLGAKVIVMPPAEGLPDMVFSANAAVVLGGKAMVARFRHPERQGEEPYYRRFFAALRDEGVIDQVVDTPPGMALEGMGDVVLDHYRNLAWVGYGPRSSAEAAQLVEREFGLRTVALKLVSDDFYHLDTALSPLTKGHVMYVPRAFSEDGIEVISSTVGDKDLLIPLAEEDARRLVANAVSVGEHIILPAASDALRGRLEDAGYQLHIVPLPAFFMGGGAVFCLTLKLVD